MGLGAAVLGAGLLGAGASIYSAHKQSKAMKAAAAPSEAQSARAGFLFEKTMPYWSRLASDYGKVIKGQYYSLPEYIATKSQLERSTAQGIDNISKLLAARGLGRSGLLGRYLMQLQLERSRQLGQLPGLMRRRAEGFFGTGLALGLQQGGLAASNLANIYGQQAAMYGRKLSGLGQGLGNMLGSYLLYKALTKGG